ncbi:hypothetical protein LDG_5250 [Legionella drancourtii LLAP12]|uniref:Uncharacterized protein n=1 Tax=Legionella drancourtii LLAP12 TaxID=658187 RepID=G9EJ92_9GAMM|nr:hypothetical protein LDG_5250 [Legionella drancourtii LLAP12]
MERNNSTLRVTFLSALSEYQGDTTSLAHTLTLNKRNIRNNLYAIFIRDKLN